MADDTQGTAAPQPGTAPAPSMTLMGQYIRDLSFENPGAPNSLLAGGGNPAFNVSISVGVKKQSDEVYAVELTLNAKANREETVLFNVELVYGGIFRLKNVPEAQLSPLLMIECPRLVFPFARQVLASVTQQGGFPPLMMEPVDFSAIYRQNLAKLAASQQGNAAPAAAETAPEADKLN
jgi:preprotein translocase subunit SecB